MKSFKIAATQTNPRWRPNRFWEQENVRGYNEMQAVLVLVRILGKPQNKRGFENVPGQVQKRHKITLGSLFLCEK